MTACISPVGDGHGLVIDKAILDRLGLRAGSAVSVALSPDGASIMVTPIERVDAEREAREARVIAAIERVRKRQAAIFKQLAE